MWVNKQACKLTYAWAQFTINPMNCLQLRTGLVKRLALAFWKDRIPDIDIRVIDQAFRAVQVIRKSELFIKTHILCRSNVKCLHVRVCVIHDFAHGLFPGPKAALSFLHLESRNNDPVLISAHGYRHTILV